MSDNEGNFKLFDATYFEQPWELTNTPTYYNTAVLIPLIKSLIHQALDIAGK